LKNRIPPATTPRGQKYNNCQMALATVSSRWYRSQQRYSTVNGDWSFLQWFNRWRHHSYQLKQLQTPNPNPNPNHTLTLIIQDIPPNTGWDAIKKVNVAYVFR